MNALRQFTTSEDGTIYLKVPAEYVHRPLEIIILPIDEISQEGDRKYKLGGEALDRLREAHRIIDEGGGIEDADNFLADFEKSRQDRPLPLRD